MKQVKPAPSPPPAARRTEWTAPTGRAHRESPHLRNPIQGPGEEGVVQVSLLHLADRRRAIRRSKGLPAEDPVHPPRAGVQRE